MEVWVFLAKNVTQKLASQYVPGIVYRYKQTQKKIPLPEVHPIGCYEIFLKKYSVEFSTDCLPT